MMNKEFETQLFEVDDYHRDSNSRLRFWYKHLRKNISKLEGDIFEFGVFRGSSVIAIGLLLKELKSDKKVYGFDSFSGFPSLDEKDDLENFYNKKNYFSKKFLKDYEKFLEVKKIISGINNFDPISLASSGNFSQTSKELIQRKIDYFGLDNVFLIEGDFKKTVPDFFEENNNKVFSANLDCDLYEGYKIVLPYLYESLSIGGFVHLDEYYSFKYPGAKIACDEFFREKNITPLKNKTRNGEFERWYFLKN